MVEVLTAVLCCWPLRVHRTSVLSRNYSPPPQIPRLRNKIHTRNSRMKYLLYQQIIFYSASIWRPSCVSHICLNVSSFWIDKTPPCQRQRHDWPAIYLHPTATDMHDSQQFLGHIRRSNVQIQFTGRRIWEVPCQAVPSITATEFQNMFCPHFMLELSN